MITLQQYFGVHNGHKDITTAVALNADKLVEKVNALCEIMANTGIVFKINPATGSIISGQTFGGFRPQGCPQGAPNSRHKQGKAVDIYDPDGAIDAWLMARPKVDGWPDVLVDLDMAIEHPDATKKWSHWQDGAPASGNRVFYP